MSGVGDRKIVHTEPLSSFDDVSIEKAKERGHSWVRRNLLSWPYNHDLLYRVRSCGSVDYLEFFFVPKDQDDVPQPSEETDWEW